MKKKSRIKAAYIIMIICLLAAGALLYYLVTNIFFKGIGAKGTKFEFNINNTEENGFKHDVTVYTENGITKVDFSGKITVDGTAEIIIIANDDGSVAYRKLYSDLKSKTINFEVDNLKPYTYYTLRFSSDNAKNGHLIITTNETLVEHCEPLEHTKPY